MKQERDRSKEVMSLETWMKKERKDGVVGISSSSIQVPLTYIYTISSTGLFFRNFVVELLLFLIRACLHHVVIFISFKSFRGNLDPIVLFSKLFYTSYLPNCMYQNVKIFQKLFSFNLSFLWLKKWEYIVLVIELHLLPARTEVLAT